jgi:hypothetical protein
MPLVRPKLTDNFSISSVATVVKKLIEQEKIRSGIKLPAARRKIAREAGITPGSLENLLRGRLKHVDRIASRIHSLRIKKIEQELAALERELEITRKRVGSDPEIDLDRAEAALVDARRALGRG